MNTHPQRAQHALQRKSMEESPEKQSGKSMAPPPFQLKTSAAAGEDKPDYMRQMEGAFGEDFSNVKINPSSSEAVQMKAQAFARGNEVHFAPGKFNPESNSGKALLGHELAHVVQQRAGKVKPTTSVEGQAVNDAPGLEQEADRMGAMAANHSGEGPVQRKAAPGSFSNVVQRYAEVETSAQSNREWNLGEDLRVSDNGMFLTSENTSSKVCFAHPSLIAQSNRELTARNSGVQLVEQSQSARGSAPNGSGRHTLKKVLPSMAFSQSGSGTSATSWEDCGRMAREVMGNTGADQAPHGVYNDASGNLAETARTSSPASQADNVLVAAGLGATPAAAMAAYRALSTADREAFDQRHGINQYAAPSIGEAFSVNNAEGFNFHWGGVVFNGGGDRVTLENFFKGHSYDSQDANWYFQMYGPPSRPGQTWHEQWTPTDGREPMTVRTSTRSLTGTTNAAGVRLVDRPGNWDNPAHYVNLARGTQLRKTSTDDSRWVQVEVTAGPHAGETGYIMAHYFTGN